MKTEHNVPLDSAELANIWTQYMQDTLAACVIEHFLLNVDDTEIEAVLKHALQLSQAHIQKITSLLNEENISIPVGFTNNDINKEASRLFTDDFYLFYLQNMGKIGMQGYTLALANSARLDITEYFTECLNESSKLYNYATEVMLNKGIFIRAPFIPNPQDVQFVKKEGYLTGWFGSRRPINVVEISGIYFNLIRAQLAQSLVTGFSQVVQSRQVRDYLLRERDISAKHIEIFGSILSEDKLPTASAWNTLPTTSTVAPFSDKLMLYHVITLNSAGIGHYGTSLGVSQRRDLGATYTRLIAESLEMGEDGISIMINNGWMEQIPQAPDRDILAKQ